MNKKHLLTTAIFVGVLACGICFGWLLAGHDAQPDQPVAVAADTPAEQDGNESTAADASGQSLTERDQGWISDIRFLQQTFTEEHPAPFWLLPREDFDRQIDELIEQVPQLTDLEIGMELQRIVAQIGDQHSQVYFFDGLPTYPFSFYMNSDGSVYLYQTRIEDSEAQTYILDYYQVVQINDIDIQYIINQLKTLSASGLNAYGHIQSVEWLLCYRDVLKAIGVPCEGTTDTFTLLDEQGRAFDIELSSQTSSEEVVLVDYIAEDYLRQNQPVDMPLLLQNQKMGFWYKYLDDEKALYFALNSFNKKVDAETFLQEMFSDATLNMVDQLVIDLRKNPGGASKILDYTIEHITARPWLRGKTYVLIGVNSFSAAVLCAQALKDQFNVVLVGMPTGGTLWGFGHDGDKSKHTLPYSGLVFTCGSVYYVGEKNYYGQKFNSAALDAENFFPPEWYNTVMPDVYIPTDIQDLAEGRDPALEWILAQ